MSFAFSFSGADISDSDDDPGPQNDLAATLQGAHIDPQAVLIHPQCHSLEDLLRSLPSQISYNFVRVPLPHSNGARQQALKVPRRALFDMRQQLMFETDPVADVDNLIEGLSTGDLQTGVYEGGFKTWECAVDLAGFVAGQDNGDDEHGLHVIEFGAGSAIPSLTLLARILRARNTGDGAAKAKVRFTLCDYNEDVLRLCTAVNVFLEVVHSTVGLGEVDDGSPRAPDTETEEEGDLDVAAGMAQDVMEVLRKANIEVDFISGAWGEKFLSLLGQPMPDSNTVILASETIYAPASLSAFTRTILDFMRQAKDRCVALIAAKKVYFGVGGGVAEFEDEVIRSGGASRTVLDVPDAGVGRVVLDVKPEIYL